MSYDGNGKPGNGVWSASHESEWDAGAVARATKRIACNASQQGVGIGMR